MLRAAAKVEVNLGEAMADYTIHSVTINVLNRYGYSLPNGWNSVANTTEIVRDNSMREYRSLYTPTGGVHFEPSSERQQILYLPEYSNTDPLTPMARMTVVLKDKSGTQITFADALSFGRYSAGKLVEGTAYDIVRNNVAFVMGEYDSFLDVFVEDMKYSDTPILSSVSENIADIYQDLKNFVCAYKDGTEEMRYDAIVMCKSNFEYYWGQRLVDVLRALHEINYGERIDEDEDY
jgi:hypothetical protein